MDNNVIDIRINDYGTLEVVTIPVKLYKDSYKVVKLRVKVPKNDIAVLKVYGSDRDDAGEQVWTTSAYTLPYKENVVINNKEYTVYEDYIPEEFCQKNGELYLTFSQGLMDLEKWVSIITSGTLNLYVSGEGFNYAGVEIPESDKLAYKINTIFEFYENREDYVDDGLSDISTQPVQNKVITENLKNCIKYSPNYTLLPTEGDLNNIEFKKLGSYWGLVRDGLQNSPNWTPLDSHFRMDVISVFNNLVVFRKIITDNGNVYTQTCDENYSTEWRRIITSKDNPVIDETDPTVPQHVKEITKEQIESWSNKLDPGDVPNTDDFATKNYVNSEIRYATGMLEFQLREESEAGYSNLSQELRKADEQILGKAKNYTDVKISELVGSAPSTLDTISEIASALNNNPDVVTALNNSIGTKQNSTDDNLQTTSKTIVGAINEINSKISSANTQLQNILGV